MISWTSPAPTRWPPIWCSPKPAPHYAGEPKARHSGAALARIGSPPISNTCNPQVSKVQVGRDASGQKEKHPLDSRFWRKDALHNNLINL